MPDAQDFALVVGIDKYDGFQALKGAQQDAVEFVGLLKTLHGAPVPSANVDPFTRPSVAAPNAPKQGDVWDLVNLLLQRSPNNDVRIGRRLYIFFAGHGVSPDPEEVGLLTSEATDDFPNYVPGRLIANLFRGRALFQEVVLCMDCCRDYDSELPSLTLPFKSRFDPAAAGQVKHFFMFASGFGSKSREMDFSGTFQGIFSRAVIDGLKGKAVDGDGRITAVSLKRYVKREVLRLRPQALDQEPRFEFDDDIVFVEGLSPRFRTVTLTLSDPSKPFVVLESTGQATIPVPVTNLDGNKRQFQLPAGKLYSLAIPLPGIGFEKMIPIAVEDEDVDASL